VQSVLGVLVGVLLLVVLTWIAIFGGIGALLSRVRGGTAPAGLAWGTGLGPIGWLAILWTTRQASPVSPATPQQAVASSYASKPAPGPAAPDQWDPWNR
jgi:hypothetical protein